MGHPPTHPPAHRSPVVSRLPAMLCLVLVFLVACSPPSPDELTQSQLGAVAALVSGERSSEDRGTRLDIRGIQDVYLATYDSGSRKSQAWGQGSDVQAAIEDALEQAGNDYPDFDYAELSLAWGFRPLDPDSLGDDLSSAQRGVRGLEVRHGGRAVRFAPSMMVADNLSFEKALSRAAQQLRLDGKALLSEARLSTFEAHQVIVEAGTNFKASQLFRGNHLVPIERVDVDSVTRSGALMQRWMLNNLHDDGRMTYMFYPVSGKESRSNNMIRQWMASLCLTRMAVASGDPKMRDAALQNIRYNLKHFYRQEQALGVIEFRGSVKLGAVALAALAILEHPNGELLRKEYDALVAMTDSLWREDGSFQNFHRPQARNADPNFHNFYPGETLLLWATMLNAREDPQRARRFMQSFRYYRDWHLAHRKPAFIPWHTQAYYLRWLSTGDEQLRDWVFEMNDWLLGMQANSRVAYDDTLGRFYDPAPQRAHFGPPHASSTGVYLEGLIDAYQLAVEAGDERRTRAYAESIRQGLRSVMQLQLQNDETLWFSPDRNRAEGGLRTTVYNNVVRVDNVQHTLMAVMKIVGYINDVESRQMQTDVSLGSLLPN